MITIRELFGVTHTIDRINVTIYDPARPVHDMKVAHWLIGWPEGHKLPRCLQWDVDSGKAEAFPVRVNVRDYPGSDARWGLQPGALPPELLDAPVSNLLMRCQDGIRHEIDVWVDMATLTAETAREELKYRLLRKREKQ
jgi:hypothetical protein